MKNKAFTLIELLVVIAIIGILATVVLSSVNAARDRAKDTHDHLQAKEFQKALGFYYLDHNTHPISSGWASNCSDSNIPPEQQTNWNNIMSELGDYLPNNFPGSEWPYCIMYRTSAIVNCSRSGSEDYFFVFGSRVTEFNYEEYSSGEAGSYARYCVYPLDI